MPRDNIFEIIVQHAVEVMPELESHDFSREDSLEDLGANSMDRGEIVMLVMESLNLNIPRTELFGPENIGQLEVLLREKLSA
jgi:polyketide biosynthesis acyl carrier protein